MFLEETWQFFIVIVLWESKNYVWKKLQELLHKVMENVRLYIEFEILN